jgi:hypothetical protein
MFHYGFAEAWKRRKQHKNGDIEMSFPPAIVLYWETTKKTPDTHRILFTFPDGTKHRFEIPAFKVLQHSLDDLADRKLLLLLPFYVLKLRKQVTAAQKRKTKKHEKLTEYAAEMKDTIASIAELLEKTVKSGLLTKADKDVITDHIGVIYDYCYKKIPEFKEAEEMIRIVTPSEKARKAAEKKAEKNLYQAAKNLIDRGVSVDVVSQSLGLPPEKIQKLQKAIA